MHDESRRSAWATNTRPSRAFSPPLSHGGPHIFPTALLAYSAVASRLGPCGKLLPYRKLATSSFVCQGHRQCDICPGRHGIRQGQRRGLRGHHTQGECTVFSNPGLVPSGAMSVRPALLGNLRQLPGGIASGAACAGVGSPDLDAHRSLPCCRCGLFSQCLPCSPPSSAGSGYGPHPRPLSLLAA